MFQFNSAQAKFRLAFPLITDKPDPLPHSVAPGMSILPVVKAQNTGVHPSHSPSLCHQLNQKVLLLLFSQCPSPTLLPLSSIKAHSLTTIPTTINFYQSFYYFKQCPPSSLMHFPLNSEVCSPFLANLRDCKGAGQRNTVVVAPCVFGARSQSLAWFAGLHTWGSMATQSHRETTWRQPRLTLQPLSYQDTNSERESESTL